MTFTWQSEVIEHEQKSFYVAITQDAYSNVLNVTAWDCDGYGLCHHKLNECSYHKDDIKKAKATYRRYINKCKKEI